MVLVPETKLGDMCRCGILRAAVGGQTAVDSRYPLLIFCSDSNFCWPAPVRLSVGTVMQHVNGCNLTSRLVSVLSVLREKDGDLQCNLACTVGTHRLLLRAVSCLHLPVLVRGVLLPSPSPEASRCDWSSHSFWANHVELGVEG